MEMFDNEFCTVEYRQQDNAVYLVWKKYCCSENYRTPTLYALDLLQKYDNSCFIIDARNGFEDDKADVKWGFEVLLPGMSKTSCKYCVMIMNVQNDIEDEMDMWTKEFCKYFKVFHVVSYSEAVEKLKEARMQGSLSVSTDFVKKTKYTDFVKETKYVNYNDAIIIDAAKKLFEGQLSVIDKIKAAYEFVRDEIPHSFDCNATVITVKASDVLKYKTGICHAKANLLAALLRSQGIPTGFCFQHITLASDESLGYCVHAYNAVFTGSRWIKLDARGNKEGVNARFSLEAPVLAFPLRAEYDEYFWPGIYAEPHRATMTMLENAHSLQDIINNIPDTIMGKPDIEEC